MKFCLDLSHHPWTREPDPRVAAGATLRAVRIADEAGLDSVWISEDPDGWDAFAVLGAAARETTRLRLGTGVTNPYLRHPNVIAMSVATIDQLSAGRAFLGLGRGQPEWYARSLGVPVGSPPAVLRETIALLRQWWQPPHVASVSGHFAVSAWQRAVVPVQPHVPIYLAAVGPRALRLAAEEADGVLIAEFASLPFLTELIPQLRQRRAAAGRDPSDFAIFVRTAIEITAQPETALERRKTLLALINTLPGMDRHLALPNFDVPALIARLRQVMHTDEVLARGGAFIDIRRAADFPAARRLIPTELIDALSYVGTIEHVRAKLRQLAALGVTHVFLTPPGPLEAAEYAALVEQLSV
ncbi:MAG TPA: LLM class flavin-dependent oxidoreductase [Thermomicrobiaceae bacterium]|nr:LLM class flavin-dependent oxidoreductase [Thermomicrobiaceae bacterium]